MDILLPLLAQPFKSLPPTPPNSFAGKTIVITGANVGLGLSAAQQMAAAGASHVILACRSLSRGRAAAASLNLSPGARSTVLEIDMSSFASIERFVEELKTTLGKESGLDVAMLNAAMSTKTHTMTEDGWEQQLQVNALGCGLLALLLLPILSPIPSFTSGQLVFVTSGLHHTITDLPPAPIVKGLNAPPTTVRLGYQYSSSKLIQMYQFRHIAALAGSRVTSVAVDPGLCVSELRREGSLLILDFLVWLTARKTDFGARTLTHAASWGRGNGGIGWSGKMEQGTGVYLQDCRDSGRKGLTKGDKGRRLEDSVWEESVGIWKGLGEKNEQLGGLAKKVGGILDGQW